jgi:glutathione S-transferase
MILYGSSLSPFVRKTLAYAGEKGIEFELKRTGSAPGQHSEEFLEASPLRKMPALRDGDYTLADSSAIIQYLEAKFPEPELIPADPRMRGRTIWFEEFADLSLGTCGGKMFFNRVVLPRFLGTPGDEDVALNAERQELPPLLDYLERTVPEPGEFLVGGRITLADIAIATQFANFAHLGCERDETRHGRVYAYADAILARPSFAPWIERERAFMASEPASGPTSASRNCCRSRR